MDAKCYIIGAGDFFGHDIRPDTGDLVIAADGGYTHLQKTGVSADVIIGDFDSILSQPAQGEIIKLKKEKDETDMLAAIKTGQSRGYKLFYIYGGTGGRLDHTLANIQALAFLAGNGAAGYLFGRDYVITAVKNGKIEFDAGCSGYLSVFAHSCTASGVSISGMKYPLDGAMLTNTESVGVSNEFTGRAGCVSVEDGTLVVIFPAGTAGHPGIFVQCTYF